MDRGFEKISFNQFNKDISSSIDLYNEYNLPKRSTKNSAGYDFYAINDFEIKPQETLKIPLGVKAFMKDDEFLMIVVRSSVGFKYNVRLVNQVGIIDSDYYNALENEGHIWVKLKNEGEETFIVKKGEHFMQGIFLKYLTCGDEVENIRVNGSSVKEG